MKEDLTKGEWDYTHAGCLGNARAKADKRIVLPRVADVLHMLQDPAHVKTTRR